MSNQHLIRKLESDDVASRREAAETLAQYPSMGAIMERDERDISDAIAPLALVLCDEDIEVRKYAARAIRDFPFKFAVGIKQQFLLYHVANSNHVDPLAGHKRLLGGRNFSLISAIIKSEV